MTQENNQALGQETISDSSQVEEQVKVPEKIIRLAVLLSGQGSNFQAIADAIEVGILQQACIVSVISNKAAAPGFAYAQEAGFPSIFIDPKAYPSVEDYDTRLLAQLKSAKADLVILAGYNRILSPVLIDAYPHRILNIHPSLLPLYGGKGMVGIKVHEAVIEAKEAQSGCTVHRVTLDVDQGPVLGQTVVPVLPEDTAQILAQRILIEEHQLYPQVIQRVVNELLEEQTQIQEATYA
jgi:phosphoribosylglycinamide formyltransferase-1